MTKTLALSEYSSFLNFGIDAADQIRAGRDVVLVVDTDNWLTFFSDVLHLLSHDVREDYPEYDPEADPVIAKFLELCGKGIIIEKYDPYHHDLLDRVLPIMTEYSTGLIAYKNLYSSWNELMLCFEDAQAQAKAQDRSPA